MVITVINVTITGLFFANLPSFTQRLKYEKKKKKGVVMRDILVDLAF